MFNKIGAPRESFAVTSYCKVPWVFLWIEMSVIVKTPALRAQLQLDMTWAVKVKQTKEE